jgi:hypothetical protein
VRVCTIQSARHGGAGSADVTQPYHRTAQATRCGTGCAPPPPLPSKSRRLSYASVTISAAAAAAAAASAAGSDAASSAASSASAAACAAATSAARRALSTHGRLCQLGGALWTSVEQGGRLAHCAPPATSFTSPSCMHQWVSGSKATPSHTGRPPWGHSAIPAGAGWGCSRRSGSAAPSTTPASPPPRAPGCDSGGAVVRQSHAYAGGARGGRGVYGVGCATQPVGGWRTSRMQLCSRRRNASSSDGLGGGVSGMPSKPTAAAASNSTDHSSFGSMLSTTSARYSDSFRSTVVASILRG